MILLRGILLASIVCSVISQDYQDYEPVQRSAPPRIRSNVGASDAPRVEPVAILKQINRHNEDGSYTYGYEGADGSFKIETKLATGEVKGKYGYVDETGKVRVVEYGANKYGFQPSGEGITVAPPTLVDETTRDRPRDRDIPEYDDDPRPQRQQYVRPSRPQPAPRPQPIQSQPRLQFPQYDDLEPEPPRRQQYSPPPPPPPQPAPVPQRLQIPGAQPTDVVYSPQQRPARPDSHYSQSVAFGGDSPNVKLSRPSYAPVPSGNSLNSQPIRPVVEQPQYGPPIRSQPPPPSYRAPPPPQGRSTSVLDQLAKDYALPQSDTQPLHDISFGYY